MFEYRLKVAENKRHTYYQISLNTILCVFSRNNWIIFIQFSLSIVVKDIFRLTGFNNEVNSCVLIYKP